MDIYLHAKNQLYILNSFQDIKIWLVNNVLDYNLRRRFFPGMLFLQNSKNDHSASFKAEKTSMG